MLLAAPVAMGALYAFASPEVSKEMDEAAVVSASEQLAAVVDKVALPVEASMAVDVQVSQSDSVYLVASEMPDFPGGMTAALTYLHDNLRYPEEVLKQKIQGRVIVQFVVEKDGSLSSFKVLRHVHQLLADETIRVLKSMPKWVPGKQKGEVVRVQYTLPIVFKLPDAQPKATK